MQAPAAEHQSQWEARTSIITTQPKGRKHKQQNDTARMTQAEKHAKQQAAVSKR